MKYTYVLTFFALINLNSSEIKKSIKNSLTISKYKYGKLLYEKPRGIGCNKCHGELGNGRIITSYLDRKGKRIYVEAPRINNINLKKFMKYVEYESKSSLIMPTYYLTKDEIESIFYYINSQGY